MSIIKESSLPQKQLNNGNGERPRQILYNGLAVGTIIECCRKQGFVQYQVGETDVETMMNKKFVLANWRRQRAETSLQRILDVQRASIEADVMEKFVERYVAHEATIDNDDDDLK